MSHIELRHLRTLVALRDTGSLVEAAERVFLTQSALSHQIKDLETRIGCSLFIRKTRPVRFTTAGKRLLKLADEALPLVHGTERDVARLAGGTSGRIFMAIECHSCFEWLLPAINAYRESWPDVGRTLSWTLPAVFISRHYRRSLAVISISSSRRIPLRTLASPTCRCSATKLSLLLPGITNGSTSPGWSRKT